MGGECEAQVYAILGAVPNVFILGRTFASMKPDDTDKPGRASQADIAEATTELNGRTGETDSEAEVN